MFVIDTVGLDPRTWLDEAGLPHTNAAKLQERWTRVDQYHLEATVTVDDPQYFTKPFQLMKTYLLLEEGPERARGALSGVRCA